MQFAQTIVTNVETMLNVQNVLVHITCFNLIAYLVAQSMVTIMKVHLLLNLVLVI